MFDSLLDSITKKVDRIHNVTDIAVTETIKLAKVVTDSGNKIKESVDNSEVIDEHLKRASEEVALLRKKLREAHEQLEVARFHAMETYEVMETLESLAGNAAQFAEPESKKLMVEHDPRLFEQSAGQLNEKDLQQAIGRLNTDRIKLIAKFCTDALKKEYSSTE